MDSRTIIDSMKTRTMSVVNAIENVKRFEVQAAGNYIRSGTKNFQTPWRFSLILLTSWSLHSSSEISRDLPCTGLKVRKQEQSWIRGTVLTFKGGPDSLHVRTCGESGSPLRGRTVVPVHVRKPCQRFWHNSVSPMTLSAAEDISLKDTIHKALQLESVSYFDLTWLDLNGHPSLPGMIHSIPKLELDPRGLFFNMYGKYISLTLSWSARDSCFGLNLLPTSSHAVVRWSGHYDSLSDCQRSAKLEYYNVNQNGGNSCRKSDDDKDFSDTEVLYELYRDLRVSHP